MLKCLPKKNSTLNMIKRDFCRSFVCLLSSNTLHKRGKVEKGGCGFPKQKNALLLPVNGFCSHTISPYLKSKLTGDLLLRKTETKCSSVEKKERIMVRRTRKNRLSRVAPGELLGSRNSLFRPKQPIESKFSLVDPKRKGKNLRLNKRTTLPKRSQVGVICLCCTTGNTICTLLDSKGQTKGFATCGSLGFTNSRKRTSYASQAVAEKIGLLSKELGFTTNLLIVKGVGRGKGSAIRAFRKNGINILGIDEKTSLPHNGCRSCRKRRT